MSRVENGLVPFNGNPDWYSSSIAPSSLTCETLIKPSLTALVVGGRLVGVGSGSC